MGFPGTDWASLAGSAIFPGAGGPMPGIWTAIAIIACVVVLWVGHASEAKKYKK
ncbi:hypothetical protein AIOL_002746 [Candidatus Rhodobacter oscarellae]|uniref:Uncharacterized protein n=1 Tax=Candidatus Rhodobacter oscarellae TaxID=1675527 RepID=A0A0J9GW40_9RHOB|nr:hypothetical protein [Candidatus Rhodobacter lobularis]KMW57778.1 hypothetical protein AIOL_002746 [Candidatus Rhodobacter lobularis]